MILTVLGFNGPYPEPGGACSGYLLSSDSGKTHLLIDCGAGVFAQLLRYIPLDALDALLLSHLHYDHMSDALPMRYALDFSGRQNLLTVAPQEPRAVRDLLSGSKMDLLPPEDLTIGELRVSFAPVTHPVPTVAIAVEENGRRMVFTGDTNENDALELFADGADLLLADCGLAEADWKPKSPHLSAMRCGALARRVKAKRLVLTHLSPRYEKEALLDEAHAQYPGAELAYHGLRIHI